MKHLLLEKNSWNILQNVHETVKNIQKVRCTFLLKDFKKLSLKQLNNVDIKIVLKSYNKI